MDGIARQHRVWRHAAAAAAVLVFGPTTLAAIAWFVWPEYRDVDMTGVHELVLFLVGTLALPALLLSFGVMAPSAIAIDRMTRGRTSRATNLLFGIAVGLVGALALLTYAGIRQGPSSRSIVELVLAALARNPGFWRAMVLVFVTGGVVVSRGMRSAVPSKEALAE